MWRPRAVGPFVPNGQGSGPAVTGRWGRKGRRRHGARANAPEPLTTRPAVRRGVEGPRLGPAVSKRHGKRCRGPGSTYRQVAGGNLRPVASHVLQVQRGGEHLLQERSQERA